MNQKQTSCPLLCLVLRPSLLMLACVCAHQQRPLLMVLFACSLLIYLGLLQPHLHRRTRLPEVMAFESRLFLQQSRNSQTLVLLLITTLITSLLLLFWQQQTRSGLVLMAVYSLCKIVWNFLFLGKLGAQDLSASLASIIGAAILIDH
ncbi:MULTISPECIES: hypothetical protein [Ferrimonas]|uniref:hypothetical protein n=1 Tax=Ferrimonas TaxID=44011 RepID=UPI0004204EC9|nr:MULTISPECIES: hypothetical protein [Ferrimonas]USD37650.1 hypothetical protein J8Z22_00210 [Ferrimonas sp. SCSIO 43195]